MDDPVLAREVRDMHETLMSIDDRSAWDANPVYSFLYLLLGFVFCFILFYFGVLTV